MSKLSDLNDRIERLAGENDAERGYRREAWDKVWELRAEVALIGKAFPEIGAVYTDEDGKFDLQLFLDDIKVVADRIGSLDAVSRVETARNNNARAKLAGS